MERQLVLLPPARPLRERFGGEFFRQLPETPGVYLLCGPRDGVLYVGKAKNLRQRLGNYRSANPERLPRKLRRLLTAVERILWDECPSESAALARERELLRTLRPRFNTVGVRPPRLDWLGWRIVPGGLELGCGESAADWPERHGPFGQSRVLHGALLRLLWWRLTTPDSRAEVDAIPENAVTPGSPVSDRPSRTVEGGCRKSSAPDCLQDPEVPSPQSRASWADMPAALADDRPPPRWTLPLNAAAAALVSGRLRGFFQEASLDLIEWCLAAAETRPRFEWAWMERDAIRLLEVYERLTTAADVEAVVP